MYYKFVITKFLSSILNLESNSILVVSVIIYIYNNNYI